jgi:hypothetical protein
MSFIYGEWYPMSAAPRDGTLIIVTDGFHRMIVGPGPKRWRHIDDTPKQEHVLDAPTEMGPLVAWTPLPPVPNAPVGSVA